MSESSREPTKVGKVYIELQDGFLFSKMGKSASKMVYFEFEGQNRGLGCQIKVDMDLGETNEWNSGSSRQL